MTNLQKYIKNDRSECKKTFFSPQITPCLQGLQVEHFFPDGDSEYFSTLNADI